jgi:pimeloyl-ACP methyl ester carboxylesterase
MSPIAAGNHAFRICAAALAALLIWPAPAWTQHRKDFTTPTPLAPGSTLIVGFLGGIERWSDENRPVVQLAERLRALELPGVYVEVAEHAHRGDVLKLIEDASGRDSKGRCTKQGCRDLRIILYGHSMGGAATVKLARELKKRDLPVALTVQVDSVGASDDVIPANVAHAANLYQHDSWMLHGRTRIRAEDPAKTQILANLRYSYDGKWVDLSEATLPEQAMHSRHTQMEFDPQVWNRVEDYILDELHRAGIPGAPAPPH